LLRKAMEDNQVTGEVFEGEWTDVGTFARWESIA
jgi:NDP-sugar pyrophosphorylase family protein